MSGIKYQPHIDGLRAVAVIPVILMHLLVPGFSGGFVGVDVFFAISGYLIASVILREIGEDSFSIARFYERRIRRILPALFLVMAVTVPIAFWLLLPGELYAYGESLVATTLFSSNFLFWHQAGYFAAQSDTKPLLHTWSLGIEEQFYIFFPLLLIGLTKISRNTAFRVLAVLAALSFVLCIWMTAVAPDSAYFLPQARAWELLAGALMAFWPRQALAPDWVAGVGLALIIASVVTFSAATAFPGFYAAVPVLGALMVIYGGDRSTIFAGPVLRSSPMIWIGRISYSAYLWHWPIIAFSNYYLFRALNLHEACVMLITTFLLAAASWHWIEQPLRLARMPRRRVFALAAIAMTAFALGGFIIYRANGFKGRFPTMTGEQYAAALNGGTCQIDSRVFDQWHEEVCTFPPHALPGTPRIFVWGDSFASHYVEGLRRLAKTMPLTVIQGTAMTCPPLMEGAESTDPGCAQYAEAMLNRIISDKPDLVLMSALWQEISDKGKLDRALRRTIPRLQKAGIHILLVGDLPLYYSDIMQLQRIMDIRGIHDQWQAPKNQVWADPTIRAIATEYRVPFFSPIEFLCRGTKCRFTDGQIFEFDNGHLTPHGSEVVIQAMRPAITKAIAR